MKSRSKKRGGRKGMRGRIRKTPRRSAPKRAALSYTQPTRARSRVRYYSKPARRVRRRSGIKRRNQTSRAASIIAAGVAAAGLGATIGALANEAGLLNKVPTQNMMGISFTGLLGAGLIILGMFTKSEGLKLLFYGLGGGLLIEELTRQVDMRFYDFRVAFLGAAPLDYSQGISGAQAQLALQTQQASTNPAQLPAGSSATSPAASSPAAPAIATKERAILNSIQAGDMDALEFFLVNSSRGAPFIDSVRQVLIDKGALQEREAFSLPKAALTKINALSEKDIPLLKSKLQNGVLFVKALDEMGSTKGNITTLGNLSREDLYARIRRAA